MPAAGQPAPDFTLPRDGGGQVSLSSFRPGKVVLYFYPKDDTPGCTVEACDFTAGIARFEKLQAVVLGCSGDSPASHRKFITKHKLAVRLLADEDQAVMTRYGAYGEKMMYGKKVTGVIRSTVIIDPAGKVAHHWAKVQAKGHAEAVRAKLAELQGEPAVAPAKKKAASKA